MAPIAPLPLTAEWKDDTDSYVDSLLSFATSSHLFINLCGGVHILDFLTREPDLYDSLLPQDWRQFFDQHDIYDLLELLLREDLTVFDGENEESGDNVQKLWKGGPRPPQSLLDYIRNIRRFSLKRDFSSRIPQSSEQNVIPRRLAVGMKTKKLHEVGHFSKYVGSLSTNMADIRGEGVTHIVDFGSGQNYLGRTLASTYKQHVIAIERKHANIRGAQGMDVMAQLTEKTASVKRNKKEFSASKIQRNSLDKSTEVTDSSSPNEKGSGIHLNQACITCPSDLEAVSNNDDLAVFKVFKELDLDGEEMSSSPILKSRKTKKTAPKIQMEGSMDYIEHEIQDGYLEPIIRHVVEPPSDEKDQLTDGSIMTSKIPDEDQKASDARVMVVSLHSCGNLLHHGVRSLVLNPSVVAIAMIGCCYNLMGERNSNQTFKLPGLRSMNHRLRETSTTHDPHGFPMSKRLEEYHYPSGERGIKLNITARMMAVQAPYNWGREDSEGFFIRHFYRALLQRIFVDRGIVARSSPANLDASTPDGDADEDRDRPGTPLIVGSLRKSAYESFPSYAKAAMTRLTRDPVYGEKMTRLLDEITTAELEQYAADYWHMKKNLSLVWSLMAFSASVVEALIVVDRWQFLREHIPSGIVKECWVEPVFDYAESPRNLAVIGIKN
jgi:hypothetical protein